MTIKTKYPISGLLFLSSILLGILVPGGPIETRDFSQIDSLVLTEFNIFLTALAIVSILIIYYLMLEVIWAYIVSVFCGLSYFLVYFLDLKHVFPVSSDSMPQSLYAIEILGTIVSVPLIIVSLHEAIEINNEARKQIEDRQLYFQKFVYLALSLATIGIGIVIFATRSAMGI